MACPSRPWAKPFNIDGLADQQPSPTSGNSPNVLIEHCLCFYHHVLGTTQINGNFDGCFPFTQVFPVQQALGPSNSSEFVSLGQLARRVLRLGRAGVTWGLAQLLNSKRLKSRAAGLALRGLGVRVCIDRRDHKPSGRCEVHVLNGNYLLDGLAQCSSFATFQQLCCLVHPFPLKLLSALQLKSAIRLAGERGALVVPWVLQSPTSRFRRWRCRITHGVCSGHVSPVLTFFWNARRGSPLMSASWVPIRLNNTSRPSISELSDLISPFQADAEPHGLSAG